jgi:sarcosine oxidase
VNSTHYDTIIIGIGAMGSATAHQLAKRGNRVLGLEKYDIPNAMGSSHGVNRIIRMAYFEDPSYVPLLSRSYELWRELETTADTRILKVTGGIDASAGDNRVFLGSLESCRIHNLDHEILTGAEVNNRFPGYQLPDEYMAVYQPDGGYVMSESAIVAHVESALRNGADIRAREPVVGWEPKGDGVQVTTSRGQYTADRLVVTVGAWSMGLLDLLAGQAIPERQVLAWFQPNEPAHYTPDRFPVFILEVPEGHFYGFPVETIPGFKIGLYHHLNENVDPDAMEREPNAADEAPLREATERYFPGAAGSTMTLKSCLFTNSPDEHFIVDLHPGLPQVAVAAGFSGHGYKFASVMGEILADLAIDGSTVHDTGLLGFDRLRKSHNQSGPGD